MSGLRNLLDSTRVRGVAERVSTRSDKTRYGHNLGRLLTVTYVVESHGRKEQPMHLEPAGPVARILSVATERKRIAWGTPSVRGSEVGGGAL